MTILPSHDWQNKLISIRSCSQNDLSFVCWTSAIEYVRQVLLSSMELGIFVAGNVCLACWQIFLATIIWREKVWNNNYFAWRSDRSDHFFRMWLIVLHLKLDWRRWKEGRLVVARKRWMCGWSFSNYRTRLEAMEGWGSVSARASGRIILQLNLDPYSVFEEKRIPFSLFEERISYSRSAAVALLCIWSPEITIFLIRRADIVLPYSKSENGVRTGRRRIRWWRANTRIRRWPFEESVFEERISYSKRKKTIPGWPYSTSKDGVRTLDYVFEQRVTYSNSEDDGFRSFEKHLPNHHTIYPPTVATKYFAWDI